MQFDIPELNCRFAHQKHIAVAEILTESIRLSLNPVSVMAIASNAKENLSLQSDISANIFTDLFL